MQDKNSKDEQTREALGPKFLTEKELATRLGFSVKWAQKRRLLGDGPAYVKIKKAVRYPIEAIERWESELSLVQSTSEHA